MLGVSVSNGRRIIISGSSRASRRHRGAIKRSGVSVPRRGPIGVRAACGMPRRRLQALSSDTRAPGIEASWQAG